MDLEGRFVLLYMQQLIVRVRFWNIPRQRLHLIHTHRAFFGIVQTKYHVF